MRLLVGYLGSILLFMSVTLDQTSDQDIASARSEFPGFISTHAKSASPIEDKGEIRKAMRLEASGHSYEGPVLDASESHTLSMQWGKEIEVQAVVCDSEANNLVERSISDSVSSEGFRTDSWDGRGYLKAERRAFDRLFQGPPTPLNESFHLVVKIDGRPKDIAEYIRLMYDVEAGPRKQREPPPDPDWKDVTDTEIVEDYVEFVLNKQIKESALRTLTAHCRKVRSATSHSENEAFHDMAGRLSLDQSKSLADMLKRKDQ